MAFSLGSQTFSFVWEVDAASTAEQLGQAGFRMIELLAMPPHLDAGPGGRSQIQALARSAAEAGVDVLGIGLPASDFNLASTDPDVLDFTVAKYQRTIEAAAELNCQRLIVVPGRKHGLLPPPDDRLEDVLTVSLDRLIRHGEHHDVRVVLENHPLSLLPKAEQLDEFITRVFPGALDIVYDVANGFAAGENPAEGLRTVARHLSHIHLSDSPPGGWKHDPIGTGGVDFTAIRIALEELAYHKPVLLEIIASPPLERVLESKAALQRLGWFFC